jgi:hypothetical protein
VVFRYPLHTQLVSFFLVGMTLLLLFSSCDLPGPSDAKGTSVGCSKTHCATSEAAPGSGGNHLIDTWNNIHLFQTFDYNISDPLAVAKRYDFVWGARSDHVAAWRAGNPNISLSYYISFNRDGGNFSGDQTPHSLAYWKVSHPDWILYKCDQVTPAYAFGDPDIPFDFSNPAIVQWQVQTYAQPASVSGYDAIAADNVSLQNYPGACGVYKNGQWVQLYSGQRNDPHWQANIINWLGRMQKGLHSLKHPLALIANFSLNGRPADDPVVQQVLNNVDGVLDEEGFTNYGSGYLTGNQWLQKVQFIEEVQKQHKPYYIINEFPSVGRAELQWAIASYLMGKEHSAALFISTIQGYGTALRYDEYGAQIGSPEGPMYQSQHVYWRAYSNGLSIVNPDANDTYTITLNGARKYTDLYGNSVGPTLTMPPHSGVVLLLDNS